MPKDLTTICLTINKTSEWRQWRRYGVFIFNFEHILNLSLVLLLLALNTYLLIEIFQKP